MPTEAKSSHRLNATASKFDEAPQTLEEDPRGSQCLNQDLPWFVTPPPKKSPLDGLLFDLGSKTSPKIGEADPYVHTNSNKWPQNQKDPASGVDNQECRDLFLLSEIAMEVGLPRMSFALKHCLTDGIIYEKPDGKLGHIPIHCHHRLCPECHDVAAYKLRKRLEEVFSPLDKHVVLTLRTEKDEDLKKNIDVMRKALRLLTHRKHKYDWVPFEKGFFWRLEVTTGKGFHPHFHMLVDVDWIDRDRLIDRWRQCTVASGGFGEIVWVNRIDDRAKSEVAKYLSKSIKYFKPQRWPDLNHGLTRVRTYGSGGSLKLPPLEKAGNIRLMFDRDVNPFIESRILDWVLENVHHLDLQPHSPVRIRLVKMASEERNYGSC